MSYDYCGFDQMKKYSEIWIQWKTSKKIFSE